MYLANIFAFSGIFLHSDVATFKDLNTSSMMVLNVNEQLVFRVHDLRKAGDVKGMKYLKHILSVFLLISM